ncbi:MULTISPECIES: hypothetical protein [Streptomyces]|uniref:GerMN domain-containing protein n=1 Tax=Streptomyces ardesiacus TaxID=285564 RepID=A0ABW8HM39_9ACTN|nr:MULTISPECIES: hypothetical protein [Streptomyces]MCL7364292.1 hypothetical protein [Streptomyces ardesiacus]
MNPSARPRTAAPAPRTRPRDGRPGRGARRALPVVLAALLPLAACGIPETGVVEAGEPATGVLQPGVTAVPSETAPEAVPLVKVPLYFVEDGALTAVSRTVAAPGDLGSTVLMLFKGPDAQERGRGLTTELPPAAVAPTIRTDGTAVTVQLPRTAAGLSDTAVDQLACTVAVARLRQDPALGSAQVTVEQPGGRLAGRSSDDCPSGAARPSGAPAETAAAPDPEAGRGTGGSVGGIGPTGG